MTLDLTVPSNIADEYVVVGGEARDKTYGEFQDEMDMFNIAFAEAMSEGDAKNRIFTFPIPTYNISRDFNWENEKLDPMWEMTAKYGIPYFANFVNSDMDPEDARSMCCRLRLDNRELRKRGGGLFGANPLTGSIGVVTINLPRIAHLSQTEEEFFARLERLMELAKNSLEIKRKALENFTENNLYPYTKHYLSAIFERNQKYWINHFSTIGLIGMNETCLNMLDAGHRHGGGEGVRPQGARFHAGPDHGLPGGDGELLQPRGDPGRGRELPLRPPRQEKTIPISARPGARSPITPTRYTCRSGTPTTCSTSWTTRTSSRPSLLAARWCNLFLGEKINEISSVKHLVKKIAENYALPYFTITPTFSVCPVHGYIPGAHKFCPFEHTEEQLIQHGIEVEGT